MVCAKRTKFWNLKIKFIHKHNWICSKIKLINHRYFAESLGRGENPPQKGIQDLIPGFWFHPGAALIASTFLQQQLFLPQSDLGTESLSGSSTCWCPSRSFWPQPPLFQAHPGWLKLPLKNLSASRLTTENPVVLLEKRWKNIFTSYVVEHAWPSLFLGASCYLLLHAGYYFSIELQSSKDIKIRWTFNLDRLFGAKVLLTFGIKCHPLTEPK